MSRAGIVTSDSNSPPPAPTDLPLYAFRTDHVVTVLSATVDAFITLATRPALPY